MSVGLCDVDVPFLLLDADLDGVDIANFVSQHFLDADVDAIHDFADSNLDAHSIDSNLDADANLTVVDFLVVDHDVHRFLHSMLSRLLSLSLLMAIFFDSMLLMHWPCWWLILCLTLSRSM